MKGKTRPQVRSGPLITGAVLAGAGTFLVLIGLAVGSSHLLSVTRQRVMEVPNELAKQKYAQARAAVAAGTDAWQNGIPAQAASVS